MDLSSLLLLTIAIIEGFVGVFQLIQMIGTRVAVSKMNLLFEAFQQPETRVNLFKEAAHGIMRAMSERSGALKGASARASESAMSGDMTGLAISGLADFLPKKYRAFAPLLAPYLQGFMEQAAKKSVLAESGSSTQGGLP